MPSLFQARKLIIISDNHRNVMLWQQSVTMFRSCCKTSMFIIYLNSLCSTFHSFGEKCNSECKNFLYSLYRYLEVKSENLLFNDFQRHVYLSVVSNIFQYSSVNTHEW